MKRLFWGNPERDIKTFLDRDQVGRVKAAFEDLACDWTTATSAMQGQLSISPNGHGQAWGILDKFAGDAWKKLRAVGSIYEETLGAAMCTQYNGEKKPNTQYNALDSDKRMMFDPFNGPYYPSHAPPRDRIVLGTAHDYYRYFAFKYEKEEKQLPEKIKRIDKIVRDLVENVVPLISNAETVTDRDEEVLKGTMIFDKPKSPISAQAPVAPTVLDPADSKQQASAPSDVAEQLRNVRGRNPNTSFYVAGTATGAGWKVVKDR